MHFLCRVFAHAGTRVIWPSCYRRWICVVSAGYRQDSIPHSAVLAENSDSVGGPSQPFCICIPSPVNFKRRAQRSVTCNHNIADVIILDGTFVKIIQSSNIQNHSIKQLYNIGWPWGGYKNILPVRGAGCVDSVWGTWCHFPCWILSSVRFWIITSCPCFMVWEVLLAVTR